MANVVDFRPENHWYFAQQFAEHLRASDVVSEEEILPDHPIWSFLEHPGRFVYYVPSFDSDPDPQHIHHVWFLISKTLCWVQRHQEVGSANYLLKIYLLPD